MIVRLDADLQQRLQLCQVICIVEHGRLSRKPHALWMLPIEQSDQQEHCCRCLLILPLLLHRVVVCCCNQRVASDAQTRRCRLDASLHIGRQAIHQYMHDRDASNPTPIPSILRSALKRRMCCGHRLQHRTAAVQAMARRCSIACTTRGGNSTNGQQHHTHHSHHPLRQQHTPHQCTKSLLAFGVVTKPWHHPCTTLLNSRASCIA
jgi:hypothetical protein